MGGREIERELKREKHPWIASCTGLITTEVCALTGNGAHNLPVPQTTLQPTETHRPVLNQFLSDRAATERCCRVKGSLLP